MKNLMWLEFDKATGRIKQHVGGRGVVPPAENDTLGVVMDAAHHPTELHYVDADLREIRQRPPTSVSYYQPTPAKNRVVLTGVRLGSEVHVLGAAQMLIVNDNSDELVDLMFRLPGIYHLRVEQWPEQEFIATVTV